MSELRDRMVLIRDTLAALYPARMLTRQWRPLNARRAEDLAAGIYSVVSQGEGDYPNYNAMEAQDGKHRILIIGQFQLAESATPEQVEDAEFEMVAEIKAFVTLTQRLRELIVEVRGDNVPQARSTTDAAA